MNFVKIKLFIIIFYHYGSFMSIHQNNTKTSAAIKPTTAHILLSYLFTASFKALPARNFGDFAAAMVISSPVLGLRPLRSARSPT